MVKNTSLSALAILLLAVLALMQYQLWLGRGGVSDLWQLKREIAIADIQNAHMLERNTLLLEDVKDLRSGDEAVEQLARNNLGMIRRGETFYRVVG